MKEYTYENMRATLPEFKDIVDTPIQFPASITTIDYSDIPITPANEALVRIGAIYHRIRISNRWGLTAHNYLTHGVWVRDALLRRMLFANHILRTETKKCNPQEYGGELELRVKDGYKPLEALQCIWDSTLLCEKAKTGGNIEAAISMANLIAFNPDGFDPNNQATWQEHMPPHITGGAVDVILFSNVGVGLADMTIANHPAGELQYLVDYFEKLLVAGKKLTPYELLCVRNRRIFLAVMEAVGLECDPREVGHFSFHDQGWAFMQRHRGNDGAYASYGYMPNPEEKQR